MSENTTTQNLVEKTVFPILFALSFSHLLNDTIQSLIPAIYPIIKTNYHLSFSQIGLITLTFQLAASLLQPFVGLYTDKKPQPYSLAVGMGFTLVGLVTLSQSQHFYTMLISVSFIGIGSSIFHPEASRMAHAASGGKRGLAQSVFQLGGNAGSSLGPLLAAWIIVPYGQFSVIWFSIIALLAILILSYVGTWYKGFVAARAKKVTIQSVVNKFSRRKVICSVVILLLLIFSKYFYMGQFNQLFYLLPD